MSPEVIAVIIVIISQGLTWLGVEVGTQQLTETVNTIVTIVSGIYLWYKHLQTKKEILGSTNVNIFGGVKN